jgi:carbamoyltransferase
VGEDGMQGAFLGPAFSNEEIETFLRAKAAPYMRVSDAELYDRIADELAAEKVVGWFQGRMEFGPRARGAEHPG